MPKSEKRQRVFDLAFEGLKIHEVYKKMKITRQGFYRNSEYMRAYELGSLSGRCNVYERIEAALKEDIALLLEVVPSHLDGFTVDPEDYETIKSISLAIDRASIAQINGSITPKRSNEIIASLSSALAAKRAAAIHVKDKTLAAAIGVDLDG